MQTSHPRSRIILRCLASGCNRLPQQTSGLGKHLEGILYSQSYRNTEEFCCCKWWNIWILLKSVALVLNRCAEATQQVKSEKGTPRQLIALEFLQREIAYQARKMRCKTIINLSTSSELSHSMHIPSRFPDTLWQNSISRLFLASYRRFFMLTLARLATDQNICDRLILV